MDPCFKACTAESRSRSAPIEQAVFVNGSVPSLSLSSNNDEFKFKGSDGLEQQAQEACSTTKMTGCKLCRSDFRLDMQ